MIPQKERLAIVASLILVGFLAACSGGSHSAVSTEPLQRINPCSVLSPADIQSALGAAPQAAGQRDNMGLVDDCGWTLPSGADVHLTFYNPTGAAVTFKPQVSSRGARDKTYEPVAGLGDQAVYKDESSQAISVSESVEVVKGPQRFEVHYVDALAKSPGPSKDAMVALARTAASHVH